MFAILLNEVALNVGGIKLVALVLVLPTPGIAFKLFELPKPPAEELKAVNPTYDPPHERLLFPALVELACIPRA